MPLDRGQHRELPGQIEDPTPVVWAGGEELPLDLDRPPVVRQAVGDPPQIHVLLPQVPEDVGQVEPVLFGLRGVGHRPVLLVAGSQQGRQRLRVVVVLVVQESQDPERPAQHGVIPRLIRLGRHQALQDLDRPSNRREGLLVSARLVPEVGDLPEYPRQLRAEIVHRRMGIRQHLPVFQRLLEHRQPLPESFLSNLYRMVPTLK